LEDRWDFDCGRLNLPQPGRADAGFELSGLADREPEALVKRDRGSVELAAASQNARNICMPAA
jgi:hypothetical protein